MCARVCVRVAKETFISELALGRQQTEGENERKKKEVKTRVRCSLEWYLLILLHSTRTCTAF